MKIKLLVIALIALLAAGCGSERKKLEKTDLETEKQKVSYAIGMDLGKRYKQQELDLDMEYFYSGLYDGFADSVQLYTDVESRNIINEWQKKRREEMEEAKNILKEKNLEEATRFLEDNAKREGIIVSPTGLQRLVMESGTGPQPTMNDTVIVSFRGTLVDGTVINDTYKSGQPAKIPVNGIMPGWTEAALNMKVGDKWKLFIPPALAYGEKGRGAKVPPNVAVIFEVELMGIVRGK